MSEENNPIQEDRTTKTPAKSNHLSLIVLIICVIASALGLMFFLNKGPQTDEEGTESNAKERTKREYLVYIHKLEVAPKKANGKDWDPRGTAPDIFYTLEWQGNRILKSDTQKDTLIANWIPVSLNLFDSIKEGKVSLDKVVKVARINYDKKIEATNKLVFNIIDDDWDGNDEIERLVIYVDQLKIGDNHLHFEGEEGRSLRHVVIRLIDNELSQAEKLEALMK